MGIIQLLQLLCPKSIASIRQSIHTYTLLMHHRGLSHHFACFNRDRFLDLHLDRFSSPAFCAIHRSFDR